MHATLRYLTCPIPATAALMPATTAPCLHDMGLSPVVFDPQPVSARCSCLHPFGSHCLGLEPSSPPGGASVCDVPPPPRVQRTFPFGPY